VTFFLDIWVKVRIGWGFFWSKSCIFSGVHPLEPRFVLLLPALMYSKGANKQNVPQLSPKVRVRGGAPCVLAVIFLHNNEKSSSGGKAKVASPFLELLTTASSSPTTNKFFETSKFCSSKQHFLYSESNQARFSHSAELLKLAANVPRL
jgi:hypothetical protein